MNTLRQLTGNPIFRVAAPAVLVLVAALLPLLNVYIPGVMPGPSYQAGAQQMLAYAFLIAAVALSYHLMFGLAGLLSFGHAMFFAVGAYGLAISLKQLAPFGWGMGVTFVLSIAITLVLGFVIATIAGAVALRVTGITFAMVTLAFAQSLSVLARRNPGRLTGGEEGISVTTSVIPDALIGVRNTKNLYWMALAILVLVYLITLWVEKSRVGTVAAATRDNELRVRVLGLQPYLVKLFIATAAAILAVIAGIGFVLLQSGTTPRITTADFTLTLLVIVVLGGVGTSPPSCGCAVTWTPSWAMRPTSTSTPWARPASSPAGRGSRSPHHSRWSPRPATCWTGTGPTAGGPSRWFTRASATRPISSAPRSFAPPCSTTSTPVRSRDEHR